MLAQFGLEVMECPNKDFNILNRIWSETTLLSSRDLENKKMNGYSLIFFFLQLFRDYFQKLEGAFLVSESIPKCGGPGFPKEFVVTNTTLSLKNSSAQCPLSIPSWNERKIARSSNEYITICKRKFSVQRAGVFFFFFFFFPPTVDLFQKGFGAQGNKQEIRSCLLVKSTKYIHSSQTVFK